MPCDIRDEHRFERGLFARAIESRGSIEGGREAPFDTLPGRVALSKGKRDKVKYAGSVHDEVHEALRLDQTHAGALHVLGMWNAEIMRLSRIERWAARNLLGGGVLGEANWDNAQAYLERAVAIEPSRITHRLDLAGVYADRGETAKAREQYEMIARLAVTDYNDPEYKKLAEERLRSLH